MLHADDIENIVKWVCEKNERGLKGGPSPSGTPPTRASAKSLQEDGNRALHEKIVVELLAASEPGLYEDLEPDYGTCRCLGRDSMCHRDAKLLAVPLAAQGAERAFAAVATAGPVKDAGSPGCLVGLMNKRHVLTAAPMNRNDLVPKILIKFSAWILVRCFGDALVFVPLES